MCPADGIGKEGKPLVGKCQKIVIRFFDTVLLRQKQLKIAA